MSHRFLQFSVNVVELRRKMLKTYESKHIYEQLFRSSTSAGANFEESHASESTKDFLHKRALVLKELRESLFWLKLLKHIQIFNTKDEIVAPLITENEELIKIISKSNSTIKQKLR